MYLDLATGYRIPPYWLNHPKVVKRIEEGNLRQDGLLDVDCACPIRIKLESENEYWDLPLEPVININCKNIIAKRNILKAGTKDMIRRGSVKELWTQDDYQLTIAGLLIGYDDKSLPEDDIIKLRNMCEAREVWDIEGDLFTIFNITKIAIEDYEFPFTKGLNNQMFTIKALSDDFSEKELMIEE
jgi:hypothetical protein